MLPQLLPVIGIAVLAVALLGPTIQWLRRRRHSESMTAEQVEDIRRIGRLLYRTRRLPSDPRLRDLARWLAPRYFSDLARAWFWPAIGLVGLALISTALWGLKLPISAPSIVPVAMVALPCLLILLAVRSAVRMLRTLSAIKSIATHNSWVGTDPPQW